MISRCKEFVQFHLRFLALRPIDLKFKRIVRKHRTKIEDNKEEIFVESLQTPFSIVALAIFLPQLSMALNSRISSYRFVRKHWYSTLYQRLIFQFSFLRAIGAKRNVLFYSEKKISPKMISLFKNVTSKRDLLQFEYLGIRIGDLIYDTYLTETKQPTLNLEDKKLLLIFADCCAITENWVELMQNKSVSAVCVSHTVYKNGIPARVCVQFGIPAYQVTLSSIYKLRRDRVLAHFDFLDYPEEFKKLSEDQKLTGVEKARERLNRRLFFGDSPELNYLPVSAYRPIRGDEPRVLEVNNKYKVLIATHDFFDSPHCNGDTLYEDFFVWLEEVAKISLKTNFDWYIKNHPFLRGNGAQVVDKILANFPHIKLIPPNTSHQQIKNEGINAVLTVYGTIGSEYAALGLTAVNACVTNPHSAYSFSLNPSSIQEFEETVISLDSIDHEIKTEEIYEYFYMHYIRLGLSWAFSETQLANLLTEINNVAATGIYSLYIHEAESKTIQYIRQQLRQNVLFDEYRIDACINREKLNS